MATTADYSSLGRLVAADEAAGGPQTFSLFRAMSSLPEFAGHPGWPEDTAAPSEHQVDELAELGWVRLPRHQRESAPVRRYERGPRGLADVHRTAAAFG